MGLEEGQRAKEVDVDWRTEGMGGKGGERSRRRRANNITATIHHGGTTPRRGQQREGN